MKEQFDRNPKKPKVYTIPVEGTRIQVTYEVYQAYYGFERIYVMKKRYSIIRHRRGVTGV